MNTKVVIGVVGMPGAGKKIVDEIAIKLNCEVVVMGDIVREEIDRFDLEPTPRNMGRIMLKLRKQHGAGVIAEKCIPRIDAAKTKTIIVDGLRSLDEVKTFRKKYPRFKVLCIHASPKTRFKRLFGRGRSDDPINFAAFKRRDVREFSVGIGLVIALADLMVINESTKRQFEMRLMNLLHREIRP